MEPGNSKFHGFNMTFVYTVFVVTLLFFLADVDFFKNINMCALFVLYMYCIDFIDFIAVFGFYIHACVCVQK